MSPVARGTLYTIASAVIFGFTPILTRMTYDGGANGLTMTFLRAVLCMPVMIALLRAKGLAILPRAWEVRDIFLACGMGSAVTTILLYSSYSYIQVGMATTLHFVYPIVVSLSCVLFFKDRLTPWTTFALASCCFGVYMFAGNLSGGRMTGVVLSLLSGLTFAFYMVYAEKSALSNMHFMRLSFYIAVMSALFSGTYGLLAGGLAFELTPIAWIYAFIVSFCVTAGGITLLQRGIQLTGAITASILSTFEPITSFLMGALILSEAITSRKVVGSVCIVAAVVAVSISQSRSRSCEVGQR